MITVSSSRFFFSCIEVREMCSPDIVTHSCTCGRLDFFFFALDDKGSIPFLILSTEEHLFFYPYAYFFFISPKSTSFLSLSFIYQSVVSFLILFFDLFSKFIAD